MATVPFIFSNQSGPIPLSQLDANFANVKANVVSAETAASVTGNSQPSINTVGTLTGLTVNGNAQITGNLTTDNYIQTGYLNVAQNAVISGNLTVTGTTITANATSTTTNNLTLILANNQTTGSALDSSGIIVGLNEYATWRFNNATTAWQTNINVVPVGNLALNLGGTSNYWGNIYGNILTVATTASVGGNLSAGGNLTVGGNVTGTRIIGTQLSVTGNIVGGAIRTSGLISATGNITAGGMYSSSIVSAVGNILASNFSTPGRVIANTITANTSITAGNVIAVTTLSSIGNVAALNGNFGVNVSAGGNIIGGNITVASAVNAADVAAINITAMANLSADALDVTSINATSIDTGSLTISTPLDVESGGTGQGSLTANSLVVGNGTSTLNTLAPGNSGNILQSSGTNWVSTKPGLGMSGETWYDVTSSRSLGTTYTNNYGYPIMIAVSILGDDALGTGYAQCYVNGILILYIYTNSPDYSNSTTFIVPTGQEYRVLAVSTPDGTAQLLNWAELY